MDKKIIEDSDIDWKKFGSSASLCEDAATAQIDHEEANESRISTYAPTKPINLDEEEQFEDKFEKMVLSAPFLGFGKKKEEKPKNTGPEPDVTKGKKVQDAPGKLADALKNKGAISKVKPKPEPMDLDKVKTPEPKPKISVIPPMPKPVDQLGQQCSGEFLESPNWSRVYYGASDQVATILGSVVSLVLRTVDPDGKYSLITGQTVTGLRVEFKEIKRGVFSNQEFNKKMDEFVQEMEQRKKKEEGGEPEDVEMKTATPKPAPFIVPRPQKKPTIVPDAPIVIPASVPYPEADNLKDFVNQSLTNGMLFQKHKKGVVRITWSTLGLDPEILGVAPDFLTGYELMCYLVSQSPKKKAILNVCSIPKKIGKW
ncbi:phosphoprotein [Marco virus]|uniref:Phosphoprotein n=1 Tax=Marco virus TaxID=1158190 RepID=A0A0D3R159_9RHAB|nr:phosphoprotein [Marco virus]AJR28449.1 phosphoprotein [Marco virus]